MSLDTLHSAACDPACRAYSWTAEAQDRMRISPGSVGAIDYLTRGARLASARRVGVFSTKGRFLCSIDV